MRYRLRTLLMIVTVAPLLGSIGYVRFTSYLASRQSSRQDGPLIYGAKFQGNQAYSDKKLLKVIQASHGLRLSASTSSEALRKVTNFYVQQGYSQVNVTLLEGDRPGDKRLAFKVVEGHKRPTR